MLYQQLMWNLVEPIFLLNKCVCIITHSISQRNWYTEKKMHAKKIGTRTIEHYNTFYYIHLICITTVHTLKKNLTTIQMPLWKLSRAHATAPLGNCSLCPVRHYSCLAPAMQLLKHYGTLDKENKYCPVSFFLIWSECRHRVNYHKYYYQFKVLHYESCNYNFD